MKSCPICGSTYADRVDFCFQDGAPLVASAAAPQVAPAPEPVAPEPESVSALDVPVPYNAKLEHVTVPSETWVVDAALRMFGRG